ncbi:4Fe-4S dicluster domain-containing protein [Desulforhopalus singaporensis]|uniref:4Fe-4S dicluster domain-containing protein n=1 Tax=Desulforhopalus singaporensis TaxID=91360 RepID=A0A1H0L5X9_9BACT|nr:4Fe-4S dicluster domain-containing protein [Desulforhopalus singaporensis]SDO63371.1 4Fe-4S dicluster domain-containing protein [Desulforhopalus singaporensis]
MGHHSEGKNSIVPLIDRLNRYPVGLPDSDTLRQILSLLFSEEEAFIASRFPLTEATLGELAKATDWPEERLELRLEAMAEKGLVFDSEYGGSRYYVLMPGLIGFFEFTFMKQRQDLPVKELAKLMEEYLYGDPERKMGREFFGSKTPLTRSLVYEEHIPVSSRVMTYERASEIIRNSEYGAVGMCYCRHKNEHLGKSCEKQAPVDGICISLGSAAKFMVRRGFAEKSSKEELLAILARARELNLTHVTDNIRHKPSFICNCCSCCCELLGGVQQGFYAGVAKTGFTLAVDSQSCCGCTLCAKACNVGALQMAGDRGKESGAKAAADPARCLGCGACIAVCPTGSLVLQPYKRIDPPEKKKDLFKQILREKKRLGPYVFATIKTILMRKLKMN